MVRETCKNSTIPPKLHFNLIMTQLINIQDNLKLYSLNHDSRNGLTCLYTSYLGTSYTHTNPSPTKILSKQETNEQVFPGSCWVLDPQIHSPCTALSLTPDRCIYFNFSIGLKFYTKSFVHNLPLPQLFIDPPTSMCLLAFFPHKQSKETKKANNIKPNPNHGVCLVLPKLPSQVGCVTWSVADRPASLHC